MPVSPMEMRLMPPLVAEPEPPMVTAAPLSAVELPVRAVALPLVALAVSVNDELLLADAVPEVPSPPPLVAEAALLMLPLSLADALPLPALALPLRAVASPETASTPALLPAALPVARFWVRSRLEPLAEAVEGPELAPLAPSMVPVLAEAVLEPACPAAPASPVRFVAEPSTLTMVVFESTVLESALPPESAPPVV